MSVDSANPKEISPEYSLEGLMLKLKLQYFGHLMRRTHWKRPWSWERLKAGREGNDREWDGGIASLTEWTWVWASSESWWWTGKPGVLQSMGSQRVRHNWGTKLTYLLNMVSSECVLSPVLLFETPWTVAHQAPLSMGFSRHEYQSGLPFPTPGDFPNPGIEHTSFVSPALAGRFFTTSPPGIWCQGSI